MVSYYIMFKAYPNEKAVTSYVGDDKAIVLIDYSKAGGGDYKEAVDAAVNGIKDPTMKNTGAVMSSVGSIILTLAISTSPVGAAIGGAMLIAGAIFSAWGPDEDEIAKEKFENDLKLNMTIIQDNQKIMID